MSSQSSPPAELESGSSHTTIGRLFQLALVALSLVYYAALMLDLVLHPLAINIDETIADRYLEALTGTGVIVVGAFIWRRVPGNRIGPLLILYGVGVAGYATRADLGSPQLTSIAHLTWEVYYGGVAIPALIVLLLSFPTGHIYPRWAARLITPYILLMLLGGTLELMSQSPGGAANPSGLTIAINPIFVPVIAPYNPLLSQIFGGLSIFFFLGAVGIVVSLILRYRAARTREQQQLKWLIWMSGITIVIGVLFYIFVQVAPNDLLAAIYSSPIGYTFVLLFYSLVNTFAVIGIGLAILRHRLWEIDIIINRTLVYGTLTILLALVYFGLVAGLGTLVRLFAGQAMQSPIVIVASTLAIAALFQPLRRRLQNIIDRRFYRRKYDAAQVVETFSATLRNEVDLSQLREHLIAVVQDTMQPSHVSLWLRKPEHDEKHQMARIEHSPLSLDEK
ncbi:MAG TPA: hypothetical protein VEH81_14750 [Ktedonobacteraceae bacterium]|nr:hypothetical protein [Ktedonobacteraceae bacterium]